MTWNRAKRYNVDQLELCSTNYNLNIIFKFVFEQTTYLIHILGMLEYIYTLYYDHDDLVMTGRFAQIHRMATFFYRLERFSFCFNICVIHCG